MEKKVIELEVKTDLPNMTQQLRQAQREVAALSEKFGATSQEAINAAKRAAELTDAIGDAKSLTDAFNPDAKFNALSASIGGVLNGFEAYEGALGLIGVESKAVEETLLKVQSAMALSQGVQGILEARDNFMQLKAVIGQTAIGQKVLTGLTVVYTGVQKALNFVMKQNPIFLIIGAVTALGGAYAFLSRDTENLTEKNDTLNKSFEDSQKLADASFENAQKRRSNTLALLESENADVREIYNARAKLIDESEIKRQRDLESALNKQKETSKLYFKSKDKEEKKVFLEQYKKEAENVSKLEALEDDLFTQRQVLTNEWNKLKADKQKESNAKYLAKEIEDDNKILAEKERLRNQLKADILANDQEQIDANKLNVDKKIADEEAYAEAVAEARKLNTESVLSEQEIELKAINEKYAKIEELGVLNNELEEARLNELNAINVDYINKAKKDKEASDEELLAQEQRTRDARFQMANDTIAGLSAIGNAFIKDQKKLEKFNKAIALTQIAVDTAKAISSLVAASNANPTNAVTFGAAGAAQLVGGLASIVANIAKAKQILSSGGSSAPSLGGGGGGGADSSAQSNLTQQTAPSFNLVGQSGGGQFLQQQPIQAYVVSGEVTSQQSLDRNRLFNATFG